MSYIRKVSASFILAAAVAVSLPACRQADTRTDSTVAQVVAKVEVSGGVHATRLDNGLQVLVVENHRAPVVVSQVWYRVGGSYEHDGITGISHVLEHMMFKGTPDVPAGRFSEIMAENGAKENAFTGKDFTAYFQRIAADRLELSMKLEADRMRNLLLSEDEFVKEIEVIKEERRLRTDDKPTALTFERFNAVAYTNSPYRQPIVGWMEDLETMEIADLRHWYQTWYAPNNAVLVVTGDVEADEVFRLAARYFGPLDTSEIPELKPRQEARQYGVQRVDVRVPASVPYLIMGYKVPVLNTAADESEAYALEVLSGLLDGGDSSRLTRHLVRGKQLATSVGASYDLYARHDSVFTLQALPAKDITLDRLEEELKQQLRELQERLPVEAEMERVKAQVVAASVYEQDSVFYQAMEVGMLETTGIGWKRKDEYVERVQAVTAEQVQQVARKYFTDDRLTVARLVPQPNGQTLARSSAAVGENHAH